MLDNLFSIVLFQTAIRTATPLILAALGGLLTMQAGILNIGMEGMILIGAFFAVVGSYYTGSALMGVLLAVAASILISLIFSLFVITLKSDEFIVGIAINIFASGLTVFLLRGMFGVKGAFSSPQIAPLPDVHFPLIDKISFLNGILNNHSVFVYISWLLVALVYFMLYHTSLGMWIRAAGEYSPALETAGVSANRMKHISSLLCGVLCGFAGAHLSLGYLTLFTENMSAGRGFIALAAVIFGQANPVKTFGAALLFGFADAFGMRLQGAGIPSQFTLMIPYLVTVIALFVVAKRALSKKGGTTF